MVELWLNSVELPSSGPGTKVSFTETFGNVQQQAETREKMEGNDWKREETRGKQAETRRNVQKRAETAQT